MSARSGSSPTIAPGLLYLGQDLVARQAHRVHVAHALGQSHPYLPHFPRHCAACNLPRVGPLSDQIELPGVSILRRQYELMGVVTYDPRAFVLV